jgi:HSP20 family protein
MALVRWQPVNDFASLQSDVNRLFNTFFDSPHPGGNGRSPWIPPMDLVERGDHLVLTADLPGLTESDVNIEVEDRTLVISGVRKIEHEDSGENYHRLERATGEFSRSLLLPDGVEPDKITARFNNGVLELNIPKPEAPTPKRVAIQVGEAPRQIEGEEVD